IFCQLGRTTTKTVAREEYVPVGDVLSELGDWLETDGNADYITLSGSGEPTLHSRFGEVIEFVRRESSIPAVLLTNGTMLSFPEVRDAASNANVVKVSLSAWDRSSFEYINRPHPQLEFERLFDGMKTFRRQFKGELWLEVFLIWGVNSVPADVKKIAALAGEIGPDRIQLNTAVRPPAEEFAMALPRRHMEEMAAVFDPPAEVIAEFSSDNGTGVRANESSILSMLQRRPCTAEQISEVFGMHLNEVSKYIGKLMRTDR
ncbi:unnamed protein product, partial [marine sediment metagenome]